MWPRYINYSVYSIENALAIGLWHCFYWSASSLFNYNCKLTYIFKCRFNVYQTIDEYIDIHGSLSLSFELYLLQHLIHNLTHICVIELNIQYLPMWFYLEKRRKCLFIDHQLTHESYNGLNVNNLPIYICVAFLTGETTILMTRFCQS